MGQHWSAFGLFWYYLVSLFVNRPTSTVDLHKNKFPPHIDLASDYVIGCIQLVFWFVDLHTDLKTWILESARRFLCVDLDLRFTAQAGYHLWIVYLPWIKIACTSYPKQELQIRSNFYKRWKREFRFVLEIYFIVIMITDLDLQSQHIFFLPGTHLKSPFFRYVARSR